MVSTFSYSSLTTFEDCPQKFKFKYVDRIKIEAQQEVAAKQGVANAQDILSKSITIAAPAFDITTSL